jgi:fructose-specific component phosphotransferase system IIB-like protein
LLTGAEVDVTVAVGLDDASAEPTLFDAFTRTRSVEPASAVTTTRVVPVAPTMSAHEAPAVSHRRHWYVNVIGASPAQEPDVAVNVFPTAAEPAIVGSDVFLGDSAAALASAEPLASAAAAARATARRSAPVSRYGARYGGAGLRWSCLRIRAPRVRWIGRP